MKIATFEAGGEHSYGIVKDGGIIDVGKRLGRSLADIEEVLAAGALGRLAELADHAQPDLALNKVRLSKPLLRPVR